MVEGDRVESEAEYMGRFRWLPSCMVHWLAAQAQDDRALWLLGPEHRVRVAATALVAYKVESMPMLSFDNMIIVVIILSSVTMSFESCALDPASAFAARLRDLDAVVMGVFVLELLAKVTQGEDQIKAMDEKLNGEIKSMNENMNAKLNALMVHFKLEEKKEKIEQKAPGVPPELAA